LVQQLGQNPLDFTVGAGLCVNSFCRDGVDFVDEMIAGEFSRGSRNKSRTMRGPSPKYFCTNSDPTEAVV